MFPTDDEVEDLLQHMDTDGEGGIELDEFLAHMADQIELRKKVNNLTNISLTMSYERRLTQSTTSRKPSRCSTKTGSKLHFNQTLKLIMVVVEDSQILSCFVKVESSS